MFDRINEPRIRNDGMMSKIFFLYFSTHLNMKYSSTLVIFPFLGFNFLYKKNPNILPRVYYGKFLPQL